MNRVINPVVIALISLFYFLEFGIAANPNFDFSTTTFVTSDKIPLTEIVDQFTTKSATYLLQLDGSVWKGDVLSPLESPNAIQNVTVDRLPNLENIVSIIPTINRPLFKNANGILLQENGTPITENLKTNASFLNQNVNQINTFLENNIRHG